LVHLQSKTTQLTEHAGITRLQQVKSDWRKHCLSLFQTTQRFSPTFYHWHCSPSSW